MPARLQHHNIHLILLRADTGTSRRGRRYIGLNPAVDVRADELEQTR